MEEPTQFLSNKTNLSVWPGKWRDWQVLTLLLVLTLGLRLWVVAATEVPARDGIGFIRYALHLEEVGWSTALNETKQQPGYPLALLVVSWPVRVLWGTTDCFTMQYSAQLTSAVSGVLLVIPVFFIGKLLFHRGIGFWGALLFQCLPVSGHVLSDALSDSLFLLLIAWSLLFGMQAIRDHSVWRFSACGFFSGLAYLVRPKGLLVILVALMILLGMQRITLWRVSWRKAALCGIGLIVAGMVAGSPYYLVTGKLTNKPTVDWLLDDPPEDPNVQATPRPFPVMASIFAVRLDKESSSSQRMVKAVRGVFGELVHAYQYVGCIPLLFGLWWCRRMLFSKPEALFGLTFFVLYAVLLCLLAFKRGYVSDRNVLLLVMVSIFQTVAGAVQLSYRFVEWVTSPRDAARGLFGIPRETARGLGWCYSEPVWAFIFLIVLTAMGLTKTLQPLHANRAGHRAAGMWLAHHSSPEDIILDDHCWAHFYSGRVFLEKELPIYPFCLQQSYFSPQPHSQHFVVISRASKRRDPSTPRHFSEEELASQGGEIVFHWPEKSAPQNARVLIYALPRFPVVRNITPGA